MTDNIHVLPGAAPPTDSGRRELANEIIERWRKIIEENDVTGMAAVFITHEGGLKTRMNCISCSGLELLGAVSILHRDLILESVA